MKYLTLIIFIGISIAKSIAQKDTSHVESVNVYFKSLSFGNEKGIASSVVIYDTYYNKLDSILIPEDGISLNVPKIDLIFKVRAKDTKYRTQKAVFYANELKDSLEVLIDPKTIDRCPIRIRDILFGENSFELDSTAISELLLTKKQLLIFDDSEHCLIIEIYSRADVAEVKKTSDLLKYRANAVMAVLSQNNKITFKIYDNNQGYYHIENPKTKNEHAQNRCVGFKINNKNCMHGELIIKE